MKKWIVMIAIAAIVLFSVAELYGEITHEYVDHASVKGGHSAPECTECQGIDAFQASVYLTTDPKGWETVRVPLDHFSVKVRGDGLGVVTLSGSIECNFTLMGKRTPLHWMHHATLWVPNEQDQMYWRRLVSEFKMRNSPEAVYIPPPNLPKPPE